MSKVFAPLLLAILVSYGQFSFAGACNTVDAKFMASYEIAIKALGQGANPNFEVRYPCMAGLSGSHGDAVAEAEMAGYLLSLVDGSKNWTKEQSLAIESFTRFKKLKTKEKALQALYRVVTERMAEQNAGVGVLIYQWKSSQPKASVVLDKYDQKWDTP
jgi:hypothetical protein